MPIASVATRCWTSPAWYIATCALRVRGDNAPSTTAAPPCRLFNRSASSYTSLIENATTAVRGGRDVSFLGGE